MTKKLWICFYSPDNERWCTLFGQEPDWDKKTQAWRQASGLDATLCTGPIESLFQIKVPPYPQLLELEFKKPKVLNIWEPLEGPEEG